MRELFVVFPGFIIGLYTIYISAVTTLGNYFTSPTYLEKTDTERTKIKKRWEWFIDINPYVSFICGILLIASFFVWLCIPVKST
jgi:hypothetical protein